MNTDNKCIAAEKPSEFGEIIDQFQNELIKMRGVTDAISEKVIKIRDFREPTCEDSCSKGKERPIQSGVIGTLISMIEEMSRYNSDLNQSCIGLEKFVG